MSDNSGQSLARWLPAILAALTVIALLGALLWRGESSLAFVAAFVILLPLTIASALMRWWPGGEDARAACKAERLRRRLMMLGAGLLIAAVITLIMGVAWSGSRLGTTLLIAGILLLPPAVVLTLMVMLSKRAAELRDYLKPDERLLHETHARWGVFFVPLALMMLTALLALGPFGVVGLGAAATLYLIVLPGTTIMAVGSYINAEAILTNRRLLLAWGLLWQKTEFLDRTGITATGIKKSWIGRILGHGKLSVVKSDGSSIIVTGLKHPRKIVELMR
jgi:hypothetical protein